MDRISKSVRVAVCIATYKRPIGLQRLLSSLREQEFHKNQNPDWRIIIVDNDILAPDKDLVDCIRDSFSIPVIYGVEPERGIASARNRAVQMAGDVDFIAFIDDDEVADCCWLDELLNAQDNFGVDVVNGPVIPKFEQPVALWVQKGRFYNRRRFHTGTEIKWANTGNVLIRSCWLHAVSGPFNETLNLSGGEDTLLFSQFYQLGAKMVWSDEAIVEEYNPVSRVSANWILRRAYRKGIVTSITKIIIDSSFVVTLACVLRGIKHILLGFFLIVPASIYLGYAGFIRSLMYISIGIGETSGIFGISYKEYKYTHGG